MDDYFNLENTLLVILFALLAFLIWMLGFIIFHTFVTQPKERESCKNHTIVSSYSKKETDVDVIPMSSFNSNGTITTSTLVLPKDNIFHYIKLDNGSEWKISSDDVKELPEVGSKSNIYCEYANKIK